MTDCAHVPCDGRVDCWAAPCAVCGWMCPDSSWTVDEAMRLMIDGLRFMVQDILRREAARVKRQIGH